MGLQDNYRVRPLTGCQECHQPSGKPWPDYSHTELLSIQHAHNEVFACIRGGKTMVTDVARYTICHQYSVADPGGGYPPPPPPEFFVGACQFENSYGPAFLMSLNPHVKNTWIRQCLDSYYYNRPRYIHRL